MTLRLVLVAAAVAALASPPPRAAAAAAEPPTSAPAAADAILPGVDLSALSPDQKEKVLAWAKGEFCYCGCPHGLSQCLREHRSCRHAPRMARLAVRLARSGAKPDELKKAIDDYYSSFDRRARLDVSQFGPPLGEPSAPVAMVEFSDFTCPYCQLVRPALEAFVKARAGRVKLFYKPFPIESHPGALAAAQAGEWAREKGIFWPMHDAIFGDPSARDADALADLAREAGGDPADLRAALASERYVPRIRASQAEAKAAGLKGTPTIFLNGRMLVIGDYSEEGLEATLQDEEEWARRGGWERD